MYFERFPKGDYILPGTTTYKQVVDFEFVVSCANNFETQIENDLELRKQY